MRVRSIIPALAAALLLAAPALPEQPAKANEFRELLQQGFQLHQRGEYAEALQTLRRAWQIDPKDYFANLLMGIDLLRTGGRVEALRYLKEASRQRPQEEFPYEYLGETEAGLAHFAEAATAYAKAAKVAPQSAQANMALFDYSLARFTTIARQLRSSQPGLSAEYRLQALARPMTDPSRRDLLRRAAEADENAPGIWSELAIADLAGGDPPAATRDLARALVKNLSDLRAWEAEALLAAHRGDWARAVDKLNAIARHSFAAFTQTAADWPAGLTPREGTASGAAANLLRCVKQNPKGCPPGELRGVSPEQASGKTPAVLFQEQRWEALAALPAPTDADKQQWYFRGAALARTGDCDSGIPALERGLGAPAESVHGMFLLSWCYAQQAGEIEKRVEKSGGDATLLHIMRGDVLFRLHGDSEAAITEYRAALAARPQDARALERLAEAQLGANQIDAARKSAEEALRLDPHRLPASRTLAEIAMKERNYAAALPYLRRRAAADPGDVGARVELGTACAQTGALDEALQYLAPALRDGYPDEKGSLHYLLGTVLRRLNRQAEAAQAFEAARRISDDFERRNSRQDQNGR